jgi:LysR family transcriptional activator of mexEF-oprN operon
VASFSNIAAIVDGSQLLATVPRLVAAKAVATRPHLRMLELPIALAGASTDLLWPAATDDDEACRFVRDRIVELVADVVKTTRVARAGSGRARSKRR